MQECRRPTNLLGCESSIDLFPTESKAQDDPAKLISKATLSPALKGCQLLQEVSVTVRKFEICKSIPYERSLFIYLFVYQFFFVLSSIKLINMTPCPREATSIKQASKDMCVTLSCKKIFVLNHLVSEHPILSKKNYLNIIFSI